MSTKKYLNDISLQSINQLWKQNHEQIGKSYMQLFEPMFSVSQIGISRQELMTWKKRGLINERISSEKNWARVNFFEYCWIRMIAELRKMEVSLNTIYLFKDVVFETDTATMEQVLVDALKPENAKDLQLAPELIEYARNFISNMPDIVSNHFKMNYNRFVQIILHYVFYGAEFSFFIRLDGMYLIMEAELMKDPQFMQVYLELLKNPFYALPISNVMAEFYDNDKISNTERSEVFRLNEKEILLIELLRKEGVKEVRVRLDPQKNKGIVFIEVVEEKQVNEMKEKVTKILQKGKMQHIRLYSSNGNLLLFEETTQYKIAE